MFQSDMSAKRLRPRAGTFTVDHLFDLDDESFGVPDDGSNEDCNHYTDRAIGTYDDIRDAEDVNDSLEEDGSDTIQQDDLGEKRDLPQPPLASPSKIQEISHCQSVSCFMHQTSYLWTGLVLRIFSVRHSLVRRSVATRLQDNCRFALGLTVVHQWDELANSLQQPSIVL